MFHVLSFISFGMLNKVMKILPVFLKNNIPVEFYIADVDSNKLILNYLICKDPITFDLSKCVVYINDKPVNFIKSNWATPTCFNVNGVPDKCFIEAIKPMSMVKFTLQIDCKKEAEEKYADLHFHLHLSQESELSNKLISKKKMNFLEADQSGHK